MQLIKFYPCNCEEYVVYLGMVERYVVNDQIITTERDEAIKTAYITSEHKKADIECKCPYCDTVKNVTWNDDVNVSQEKCNKCNKQFIISRGHCEQL